MPSLCVCVVVVFSKIYEIRTTFSVASIAQLGQTSKRIRDNVIRWTKLKRFNSRIVEPLLKLDVKSETFIWARHLPEILKNEVKNGLNNKNQIPNVFVLFCFLRTTLEPPTGFVN